MPQAPKHIVTIQEVVEQFEKNSADQELHALVMPPAGSTINTLRNQIALLITYTRDLEKHLKEVENKFNETVNDFTLAVDDLKYRTNECSQEHVLFKEILLPETSQAAEEIQNG